MKTNKSILALIVAALLPAFAYAGTDAVTTSFERGLLFCEPVSSTMSGMEAAIPKKSDPIEDEVNALVNSTSDPVLASYYRDLYRAPFAFDEGVRLARENDPIEDEINMAVNSTGDPVLASYYRDLYRTTEWNFTHGC